MKKLLHYWEIWAFHPELLLIWLNECASVSLCLDETTDIGDVSQLLIYVKVITPAFEVKEEMLALVAQHGTTKGVDI